MMKPSPIIRQTDRQTDRQAKSVPLFCSEYVKQARSARSFFGRDAPFCVLLAGGDGG